MSNSNLSTQTSNEPCGKTPNGFQIEPYREQGSMWAWTAYPGCPEFESTEQKFRGLSCYQYAPPLVDPAVSNIELTEAGLVKWLEETAPLQNGKQHCGGYKILQINVTSDPGIIPVSSESFIAITKAFGTPPVELHIPSAYQGSCGIFLQDDGSFVFIRRSVLLKDTIGSVLRYDPTKNFTKGYIVTCFEFAIGTEIFRNIHNQFLACPHPLVIPISMTELDLESAMRNIRGADQKLYDIEDETGFTAGSVGSDTPNTTNYQQLVRKLGEAHAYYSRSQTNVLAIKLAVHSHMKHLKRLDTSLTDKTQQKLRGHSSKLSDRLEYLLSSVEHAVLHRNMATRLQSQQSVLFNLIAQADNDVNLGVSLNTKDLAVASKRDSSAMKIIAFLTTLFLPGTFVASFVAMPLFDWEAASINKVPTTHFWIYWAITAPLTLATMAFVLSWAFLHGRKTEDLIQAARTSASGNLPDVESGKMSVKNSNKGNKWRRFAHHLWAW